MRAKAIAPAASFLLVGAAGAVTAQPTDHDRADASDETPTSVENVHYEIELFLDGAVDELGPFVPELTTNDETDEETTTEEAADDRADEGETNADERAEDREENADGRADDRGDESDRAEA